MGKKPSSALTPRSAPRVLESPTGIAQPEVLLDATTFAVRRGCALDALPQACIAHRIFCVTIDGAPQYPAFYVDPRFDRRRLESITKLLGCLAGGSKWQFFTRPKGSLGSLSPLQALLAGRYEDVRASALAFSER